MMHVQVSAKHKAIVAPASPEIQNLFPNAIAAQWQGGDHFVLPHRPTETFMLRRLGYDVPSPILSYYDWAGGSPFDVQRQTCAMLTMNTRAYVLNGMGTGKTKAALWAWDYLRSNGVAKKLLVVAPLSTLNFTWQREVLSTLPHRKAVTVHGTKKRRLERLNDPDAAIFIINHDGIKVVAKDLEGRTDIDTLVIDELAVYRNGQSDRTKAMRKFAAAMQWVWGMTGSPIPNGPCDVWAEASIVTPDRVPKFFNRFRDSMMTKVGQFKYLPKPDAVERAFDILQPAVRYTLDDVTELPDLIERTVDVDMGTLQAKIYKQLADTCMAAVANGEITAANAGAVMMKLLQVATGWVYTSEGNTAELDNDDRIKAMVDAVMGTDRKVLVFVPFKHALAGISKALDKEGIEHATVSGDTSARERGDVFYKFQNTSTYHVIAAHPQCLAHGITLTAADTVIWFAPVTSLEIYDQANHRIRRVGQKHKQLILHLQSTPVEKRIYRLLRSNQQVQSKLLDLFAEASASNPER